MKKQPSNKSATIAIIIWGCVCYTIYSFLQPLIDEFYLAVLGLFGVVLLYPLLDMTHKYLDKDEDIESDYEDDSSGETELVDTISHGEGKYTSRAGHSYERFRPKSGVMNRNSYRIDETFEVAGTFARQVEINTICDWLAAQEDEAEVTVVAEKEPANPYDRNAVKLLLTGDGLPATEIGYLPKELAKTYIDATPIIELETIYQRREITARTLVKRAKKKK